MKIVMTLMVRDEADIIGAMLEHHFAQGVDHMIVTDNASVDGTTEILQEYAAQGLITLHHDPRHEKQQAKVVTQMAREASTDHDATWVLNADADEFWVAEDHSKTLRQALQEIPTDYRAFPVPVIDMIGDPAHAGSGIDRLIHRDTRPLARINALGLHAHATPDVAFVATPDVEVVQGNHFVNVESQGSPTPGTGIEVLHLPWRSWKQFSTKVGNAGLAYERSGLTPSPNHHGMRDYKRLQRGTLYALYLARHPQTPEREAGRTTDLVVDRRLADSLTSPVDDIPVDPVEWRALSEVGGPIVSMEQEYSQLQSEWGTQNYNRLLAEERSSALETALHDRDAAIQGIRADQARFEAELQLAQTELERYRNSRVFRVAHAVGRRLPGRRRERPLD